MKEHEGVALLGHENFRWQAPMRRIQELVTEGRIGRLFRARVTFNCSFPVFDNQPALREAERFILADLGVHTLDLVRWLFGEARSVVCHTARINPHFRGEDVATVLLEMDNGVTVVNELSYASVREDERCPQTYVTIEGAAGRSTSARITGSQSQRERGPGSNTRRSKRTPGPTPAGRFHASIPACQANPVAALRGEAIAETPASDNLRTLRLVEQCYASARGQAVS